MPLRTGSSARPVRSVSASGVSDEGFWLAWSDRLARALAGVINILDPEVIVLGGGLSNLDHIYRNVPARLPAWVFSDHVATRLVRAAHGDSSGVRGAAWLWPPDADPAS